MVEGFGPEEAVKSMVEILRKMTQNHLAEQLENKYKEGDSLSDESLDDTMTAVKSSKLFLLMIMRSPLEIRQKAPQKTRSERRITCQVEDWIFRHRGVEIDRSLAVREDRGNVTGGFGWLALTPVFYLRVPAVEKHPPGAVSKEIYV
ncbi:hypothetical protein Q8A67_005365 [Cirrhinus molitorella]|uniref:Uncharacterized protein n=1 Tax=Cirrhinus molitorella TaxID=172907 RepID=A0AA88TXC6_9TELE|nr:hypothetical protein Q8A67_005365 [Cirrhinus molitorella]